MSTIEENKENTNSTIEDTNNKEKTQQQQQQQQGNTTNATTSTQKSENIDELTQIMFANIASYLKGELTGISLKRFIY